VAKSWTIGSRPDCDLVVKLPRVSGYHCRLVLKENGYDLEDLGSTNGTYVNGVRVTGKVHVSKSDSVTLGVTTPMPWPSDSADNHAVVLQLPSVVPEDEPVEARPLLFQGMSMVIGRASDCDRVLDLPMISSHHARLSYRQNQIIVEDLGSANGTFVNGQRVVGTVTVKAGDRISLGSYTLVLSVESAAVSSETANAVHSPMAPIVFEHEPAIRPTRATPPARRLAALLAQTPIVAVLIVMAVKVDSSATRAVASGLFGLALAAVWFGLSNSVFSHLVDVKRLREGLSIGGAASLGPRLAVLGGLCVGQCVSTWVMIVYVAGLNAPWLPALALLALASAVGLAMGLLIVAMTSRPVVAWASLAMAMLILWVFGGGSQVTPRSYSWSRTVSYVLPSRWAFEGLLLLESERHELPKITEAPPIHDLAEDFFPSESERMGVRADVMALGLMLVGLVVAVGFISGVGGRDSSQLRDP